MKIFKFSHKAVPIDTDVPHHQDRDLARRVTAGEDRAISEFNEAFCLPSTSWRLAVTMIFSMSSTEGGTNRELLVVWRN
jgi:hypothetical protein